MLQFKLFDIQPIQEKRKHNSKPSYYKSNKILNNIRKWNTIKHIYRYQTFYKICEKLFLLTYNNQLACLDYYIDEERDERKHYTVMYACLEETSSLSISERIKKHIDLLRQIKNGVEFEHDIKKIDSEVTTLFG